MLVARVGTWDCIRGRRLGSEVNPGAVRRVSSPEPIGDGIPGVVPARCDLPAPCYLSPMVLGSLASEPKGGDGSLAGGGDCGDLGPVLLAFAHLALNTVLVVSCHTLCFCLSGLEPAPTMS